MTSFSITDNISPSKIIPLLHWLLQTDYLGFTSDIKNRVGGAVNKILCDGRYIIKLMQSKDREFGEPNLDIRQHVDWMKSYSQEAWQDLQQRVARMGSVLRAHHRAIPKAELKTQLQQLAHTLHQVTTRQQLLHQDIKNIRLDVNRVQEGHILLREESQDAKVETDALRNNYARISTDMKNINQGLHEFQGQLKQTHRDINQLKSNINKDVLTINQNLNKIRDKAEKIEKKNDGEIYELKRQFDSKIDDWEFSDFKRQVDKQINWCEKNTKKISKDLIKEQKSRIGELREKMIDLSEIMNKFKGDMSGLAVGLQEVKINLLTVAEDAAKNQKNIQNNRSELQSSIKEVLNTQEQAKVLRFKLEKNNQESNWMRKELKRIRQELKIKQKKNEQERSQMDKELQRLRQELKIKQKKNEQERSQMNKELRRLKYELIIKQKKNEQERSQMDKELQRLRQELKIKQKKNEQERSQMNKELQIIRSNFETKERKEIKKIMKQNPEQMINNSTPCAASFHLHKNTITLKHILKEGEMICPQQLLMNVEVGRVFTFTVHITKSKYGHIVVGVVNRDKQKEAQSSDRSCNAVCYGTHRKKGRIGYGDGGEFRWKDTDDRLKQGMEVKMKVEEATVTFILTEWGWLKTRTKEHVIVSPILSHPRPEFVPFVQMWNEGDSVEWDIQ